MKKIRKIALWGGLVLYLVLIAGFVSGKRGEVLCNELVINISDSVSKKFIVRGDVMELLDKKNTTSLGTPISTVNTHKVEESILSNSLVKSCDVYARANGKLHIDLIQREPVVRIIDKNGNDYYLDSEGSVIAMSKRFTPHLLVVNGNIHTPFRTNSVENIYKRKFNGKAERLRDIHKMALFIKENEFWNAQVEQLYVTRENEFELIPRIGPHIIELGSADNFEGKLAKLKIFYTEGLNKVGWNKYLKINLKYKNQVVCTKNSYIE